MVKVAFVGLGSMGGPLAQLIAKTAFDLAVYDPYPKALEPFAGSARVATSPGDAARGADIGCVCVRDDSQVRDVLFGADGMAKTLAEKSLVLIHSTISTGALEDIAARLAGKRIAIVDAPVSRTRQTIDGPFVYTMMGGEAADVERAQPLVDIFSTDSNRMGPLGAGMATKIANNLITWTQIIIAVQGVTLATESGVGLEQLLSVMRANGNLTPTMEAVISGKFKAPPAPERAELYKSQGGIGEKDVKLAFDTAEALGMDTRLIAQAHAMVRGIMAPATA